MVEILYDILNKEDDTEAQHVINAEIINLEKSVHKVNSLDKEITEEEVRKSISFLKSNKSSEYDGICSEMLKYGMPFL